jgi:HEAT repeat protein
MSVSSPFTSSQSTQTDTAASTDPRLTPTPDWGSLGPGSELGQPGSTPKKTSTGNPGAAVAVIIVMLGIGAAAMLFVRAHSDHPSGAGLADLFSEPKLTSAKDTRTLDRMKPQQQAEALLELAVANSDGAVDEINARLKHWHRQLQWTTHMRALVAAALNSKDRTVRETGVEVEIVSYGLAKNQSSLDYTLKYAEGSDHGYKIWALWSLGLLGNRGVGTDQVIQVLTAHLNDPDEDSRRWAVEGLALTGADAAIAPLLKTMHDDPASNVRGRAAAGIGESGLFTPEQRFSAIPQLLNYTDDRSLDAQTQGYAFHALRDITHQALPNNTAAWRGWYEAKKNKWSVASGK